MNRYTCMAIALLMLPLHLLMAQDDVDMSYVRAVDWGDGRTVYTTVKQNTATPLNGYYRITDDRSGYVVATYVDGFYNGEWKSYRYTKLQSEGLYNHGRREGLFKEYYSDGAIKSERNYTNGKLDGVSRTYYADGKLDTEKGYKDGKEDGIDRKYDYQTGTLRTDCHYRNGVQDGKQIVHISSNQGNYIEESNYDNGIRVGEYKQTFPDDNKVRVQGLYKAGKKEGQWIEYNKSGVPLQLETYKNGELQGESRTYYVNGNTQKVVNYVNGKKEGISTSYSWETGKIKSEETYVGNKLEGPFKNYYDDGSLRIDGRASNGSEVFRKEYYHNGQVKEISEYGSRGWETIERYDSQGKQL